MIKLQPLILAGILIGIGQGGFFDGIVLHQLLQWHHMFSNVETTQTVYGLELNTVGDGLFDLLNWLFTLGGIFSLWYFVQRGEIVKSNSIFIGSILTGFGSFNLVEGIIDHHLLQIHHVKPGVHQLTWDLGFLGVGLLLIVVGIILINLHPTEQQSVSD